MSFNLSNIRKEPPGWFEHKFLFFPIVKMFWMCKSYSYYTVCLPAGVYAHTSVSTQQRFLSEDAWAFLRQKKTGSQKQAGTKRGAGFPTCGAGQQQGTPSAQDAQSTPSTGEKQEPHMLLSGHGSFLSEVYLGGHSWIIHSEQLFGCPCCCICLKYGCPWRGLCWEGEFQKASKLPLLPVLRNWFYFCLILVVFVRRTAGLVTAPREIKLTEPICSHKINRSGLWV